MLQNGNDDMKFTTQLQNQTADVSSQERRNLLEENFRGYDHVRVKIVNFQIVYFDALTGKPLACCH